MRTDAPRGTAARRAGALLLLLLPVPTAARAEGVDHAPEVAAGWFAAVKDESADRVAAASALPFVTSGVSRACEHARAATETELRAVAGCFASDRLLAGAATERWRVVSLPGVPRSRRAVLAPLRGATLVRAELTGDGMSYTLVLAVKGGKVIAAVATREPFE